MIEKHPFGSFVPQKSKFLILGSFPGKEGLRGDWYYGGRINQFWKIMEKVYDKKLNNIKDKKRFLIDLKIAIADIISECERIKNNNSDENLKVIKYNIVEIKNIIRNNPIEKIFFTSLYVEKLFRKNFKGLILKYPKISIFSLPSPSPRFAKISLKEKIKIYKKLLPCN